MTSVHSFGLLAGAGLALGGLLSSTRAEPHPHSHLAPVDSTLAGGLVWRNVGPFRGGRIASVTGVVGQPGVFYVGLPAGGAWKTTSAGEVWYPIFDAVKSVSAVGAIEVAPSDPNVIYAGTGDMVTGNAVNEGDGVYRSTDAGHTWQHVGLEASKQIPSILVDPKNPDVVLVATQGDLHRKTADRGVFRSTDGGKSWTKTLFIDETVGAQKLAYAYDVPSVIFATTDRHYYEPGAPPFYRGTPDTANSGTTLWKSTDEGVTWHRVTGGGLPGLYGRTSIAVAQHTNAQRVYLVTNTGLYRSDDGGSTWRQMDPNDERVRNGQGGYNCGVYVDPQNPDIVYVFNTSSYISRDGGNTFTGFKGAPGGDDPQQLWIDPTNGQRILMGMDQGATVTLDGGHTWSSWYNQSTEQVYHLSTDNSFPYWIYASQQDAGAIRQRSRGNLGEITPLDWNPVPGWEWGTIVPDPLHNDTVYASGAGIVKISYPDEQWINVSPISDPTFKLRTAFSQPLAWAPWNQHQLLAGFQYLMSTTDGGMHWTKLGGDLSVRGGGDTTSGAIESISASTVKSGVIWVGTNNGVIQVTRDGGRTWSDVRIANLPNAVHADVQTIEASHTDPATAYAAVDIHSWGDYAPYFYRTHDYGRTWTKIVEGLPQQSASAGFARVIRADTKKAGLLFAGTESAMYVSFDDGDHWQSLQLNLPNTSYRDLTIHGNDLVAGTYGRGIWILDDYTVLRQITPALASEPAHLFKPDDAVRLRRNVNADTPFPPEVPHALNRPDGVIVYYSLAKAASAVSLDVLDASGKLVRHLSNAPITPVAEAAHPPEPNFWLAAPKPMPASAGMHRVNWDLRYDAPPAFNHSFEINANPGLTPPSPEGLLALPGEYTLRLTVDGNSYTQKATVLRDPRSRQSMAALEAQHTLLMKLDAGLRAAWEGQQQVLALRAAVRKAPGSAAPADLVTAAGSLGATLDTLADSARAGGRRARAAGRATPTFVAVSNAFVSQLNAQDNGDMAPTPSTLALYAKTCGDLRTAIAALRSAATTGLTTFNSALSKHGISAVTAPASLIALPGC